MKTTLQVIAAIVNITSFIFGIRWIGDLFNLNREKRENLPGSLSEISRNSKMVEHTPDQIEKTTYRQVGDVSEWTEVALPAALLGRWHNAKDDYYVYTIHPTYMQIHSGAKYPYVSIEEKGALLRIIAKGASGFKTTFFRDLVGGSVSACGAGYFISEGEARIEPRGHWNDLRKPYRDSAQQTTSPLDLPRPHNHFAQTRPLPAGEGVGGECDKHCHR